MSSDYDRPASVYRHRLHPWCIIQCFPNAQTEIIARFRRRNDAEAHMQALRRLAPTADYEIVFDPAIESTQADHESARENPQPY